MKLRLRVGGNVTVIAMLHKKLVSAGRGVQRRDGKTTLSQHGTKMALKQSGTSVQKKRFGINFVIIS